MIFTSKGLSLFIKGLAIGTAAIIPGISGGTIAFMLGIYDELITALVGLKKQFFSSMKILFPVGLGVVVAIALLTFPIGLALQFAPFPTITLFAGLIVGSLPALRSSLPKQWTSTQWFLVGLPALIALLLGVFSVVGQLDASAILTGSSLLPKFSLIVIGMLGVSAFIVPGISGSMLLLTLGFYEPILNSLERLLEGFISFEGILPEVVNFGLLGVGAIIGFVLLSLLMHRLLSQYRIELHLGVFGFIIGSIGAIFFNDEMVIVYETLTLGWFFIGSITFMLGVFGSWKLSGTHAPR